LAPGPFMNQGAVTDEKLMRAVLGGCRQSLARLIRRNANRLLTFLVRMTGNQQHAEELFQDVCGVLWLKRHRYDPDRPFRPWLFKMAANHCRAQFRQAGRRSAEASDPWMDGHAGQEQPGPLQTLLLRETCRTVQQAVCTLPPKQRLTVALRVWDQMSYAHIGQVLGCAEATARAHMHQALQSLRRRMTEGDRS
ncbi:MAG: RNA polymerase sigma factor, partial [Phycisphaeraceae bacterium]|nr:RNA polymerase sigma factor [Phycisphaeraceae bacterium]